MAENETTDTKKMNAATKKAETEVKSKAVEAAEKVKTKTVEEVEVLGIDTSAGVDKTVVSSVASNGDVTPVSDPVLTQVLQRLDNIEGSNKRLEADNKKLKEENEKLTESLKENAELKSRLEAMDKQIKTLNVAENLTEEQRREIFLKQRAEKATQIKGTVSHNFHAHTAVEKPITDDLIKAERKTAGKSA